MAVSLLGSSDHFEEIEELDFKDSHFLAQTTLPSVFVEYQTLAMFDNFWETMGVKSKAVNWKRSTIETPSSSASLGDEQPLDPL